MDIKCPLCNLHFTKTSINIHVEMCLSGMGTSNDDTLKTKNLDEKVEDVYYSVLNTANAPRSQHHPKEKLMSQSYDKFNTLAGSVTADESQFDKVKNPSNPSMQSILRDFEDDSEILQSKSVLDFSKEHILASYLDVYSGSKEINELRKSTLTVSVSSRIP